VLESSLGAQPRPCSLDPPSVANSSKVNFRESNLDYYNSLPVNRKSPAKPVRHELVRPPVFYRKSKFTPVLEVSATPCSTRTYEPTMGNSPSSGLGSGSAHGLRDVRTAKEPNENPREFMNQLPVPPKPYTNKPGKISRRVKRRFSYSVSRRLHLSPITESPLAPAPCEAAYRPHRHLVK